MGRIAFELTICRDTESDDNSVKERLVEQILFLV